MTQDTLTKGARPGQILALLFAGVFMGALDISIIGPVLHPIQHPKSEVVLLFRTLSKPHFSQIWPAIDCH